jgi:hypothetical protein
LRKASVEGLEEDGVQRTSIIYLNVSVYRFVKVWVVGKECSLDDSANEMAVVRDSKTIVQPVVSSTVIYLLAVYGKALLSR